MNSRPLYENLDTSFVNLSALVKYLRRREFVGRIRVELNNYQADIVLYEGNKISVNEHDKISGLVAEGEAAFQRLLIRSREAGGIIHVYQTVKAIETKEVKLPETPKVTASVPTKQAPQVSNGHTIPIPKPVEALKTPALPQQNGAVANGNSTKAVKLSEVKPKNEPVVNLPKFPFDLRNNVEEKAKKNQVSEQDWQNLLGITGELLGWVDISLGEAKLDFRSAFTKARTEISSDYPFLNPSERIFDYKDGKILMREKVSPKLFVISISEALRRILEKLGANPKFSEVYRKTTQRILGLVNQRKTLYDKFSYTQHLKKILGV